MKCDGECGGDFAEKTLWTRTERGRSNEVVSEKRYCGVCVRTWVDWLMIYDPKALDEIGKGKP